MAAGGTVLSTTPETPVGPGPRRAAVVFVFVTVLIDVLAMGLIIPVLPRLVLDFIGGDAAHAARWYGLFATVWALMQFFASPFLGALSDRFGRRPVILLSCLGLGLDYVFMALAPSLPWLLVGRIISGVTAAGFSTAMAYISDVTPPEKRAASFGMLGAAFGAGFVLGPAVGGLLGGLSPRAPFWVAGALALAWKDWRVRFEVAGRDVQVRSVTSGYRSSALAAVDAVEPIPVHREFLACWPEGVPPA